MAFDAFLKIDGITTDKLNGIELESFSWGVSNAGTSASGDGSETGRASFTDFTFSSQVGQQSPQLFQKCVTGEHIESAMLVVNGGRNQASIMIKYTDVLISNYQFIKHDLQKVYDAAGKFDVAEVPTESVSLNFAKIEFSVGGTVGSGGGSGKIG